LLEHKIKKVLILVKYFQTFKYYTMNKLRYLLIYLLLAFTPLKALSQQGVYYDAMFIKDSCYEKLDNSFKNKDALYKILIKYYPEGTILSESLIKQNPFFNPLVPITIKQEATKTPIPQFSLSQIGGLDVTNIADGFAKFLVKRTKQELNAAFFQKFKEAIADTTFRDLQTIFPQTYRSLTIIGDEIYNYEAYLQTLRESFENDLANLPTNLPSIIDNHPEFFEKLPWLQATLESGCYISKELRDKIHPGDILKDYPVEYLNRMNKNWKGAVQTLQLISSSLRDSSQSDSVYWVNISNIKKLAGNKDAFRIYLGLIYQQATETPYDSIEFQGTTLIDILTSIAGDYDHTYDAYKNYIIHFGEKANRLNAQIKNYSKHASDSLKFEQYASYFNGTIDLLQYMAEVGKLPYVNLPYLADSLKDYFDVAHSTSDLVLDINRRNYGSAITNTVHIYEIILNKYFITDNENKEAEKMISDIAGAGVVTNARASRDLGSSITNLSPAKLKQMKPYADKVYYHNQLAGIFFSKETIKKIFKYGTLMASIVQAKNSDDVAAAIEAAALPSGSSRIKRETPFNVSLNAYAGLFTGHETISGVKDNKVFNTYGVTAPIGVALSWGVSHWSLSAFFSFVDIGTVAAFRFQNDTIDQVPTIQLKDIVSPGAFLSIGIPKSPLSVNLGAQMGPNLRNVYTKDVNTGEYVNSYQNSVYWRFSASLLVDIPLLNFYTKSKK
jgi:hypothetical protein